MKEKLITFRMPIEIDKEIERISYEEDSDKSKLIRELIVIGIKARRLDSSIKLYSEGQISLWKASRIAGISLWKMMEIIRERKIDAQYGKRELREDIRVLNNSE